MCAFVACEIIIIARIIYIYLGLVSSMYFTPGLAFSVKPPGFDANFILTNAMLVALIVSNGFVAAFFAVTWRDFGWKLYKTVGTNKELICTRCTKRVRVC